MSGLTAPRANLTFGSNRLHVPDIELHECRTMAEASALLSRYAERARILAGGTDLLVDLKTRRLAAEHLVSLRQISELSGLTVDDQGLRIGALTTITELHRSTLVCERFSPLLDATGQMAAPQVRNLATVGGNLASAVPCADLPPILMVLGASAILWCAGIERRVALGSFFTGVRRTVIAAGEILTAVIVPPMPKSFGAAYARFALREGNAIAVAGVAASLQLAVDGTIRNAHLALGAVAPIPQLVRRAADVLIGAAAGEASFAAAARTAMAEAKPISDVRGSAAFRRELVGVLSRRALQKALARAKENR